MTTESHAPNADQLPPQGPEAKEQPEARTVAAEPARRIEEEPTGRPRRADTERRVAESLERIAETVEKILGVLTRSAEGRRERPRPEFRGRPPGEEGRRPSGYPGQRRDRYPEGRGPYGRPSRRFGRADRTDRGR
jgi:hypothetical protein